MASVEHFVVLTAIAFSRGLSFAQIASLHPAEKHDRAHEKRHNKRHEDASTSPVLVPRVHFAILKWCVHIVNEFKLKVCGKKEY